MRGRAFWTLVAAVLVSVMSVPAAHAAFPGLNGKIAFDDDRHQRDHERPGEEHVHVEEGHLEQVGRPGEEREQRVIQKETAEQEQRRQTLSLQ